MPGKCISTMTGLKPNELINLSTSLFDESVVNACWLSMWKPQRMENGIEGELDSDCGSENKVYDNA